MKLTNLTKREHDFSKLADAYLDSKGNVCVPVVIYVYDEYCEETVPVYVLHSITVLETITIQSEEACSMREFLELLEDSGEYIPITFSNIEFSENIKQ